MAKFAFNGLFSIFSGLKKRVCQIELHPLYDVGSTNIERMT